MSNSLQHVGVLGMRWGVRRAKRVSSEDHVRAASLRKKKLHEMSNEEIRTAATRASLEKQYRDLNPGRLKRAAKRVDNVLTTVDKVKATSAAVTALIIVGKQVWNNREGIKARAQQIYELRSKLAR